MSNIYRGNPYKNIIAANHGLEQYIKSINTVEDSVKKTYGSFRGVYKLYEIAKHNAEFQEKALKPLGDISKLIPSPETMQIFNTISKMAVPLQMGAKQAETLRIGTKAVELSREMQKSTEALEKIAEKQYEED